MSEPIRKHGDISKAPTPQNTPLSVANLYLKQQPPSVSTITEEDDLNLTKQLANNPALLLMIQGKLGLLVGQLSGYVELLPRSVKRRVWGLKAIQQQQMKLEADFQKELLELEKKYFKKYEPLYEKRRAVVNGDAEPTPEEVELGEELEAEERDDDDEDDDAEEGADVKGVPSFWLTALENLQTVSETITERDAEVLQYVKDIRMEYLETPGFELLFEFNENPYLSNLVLTKTYHYQAELGYLGDFVYDHADGCEINWKLKEKNVTINIERRKQRNKTTKQTRTIEKLTPTESFFNFFDPPRAPKEDEEHDDDDDDEDNDDEDADEDADLEERLELDYQLGEEIKDRLIPRAIDWFTGDAVGFGYPEDFAEDDEEFDSEEDDDDADDDDINESGPKENAPECKQQ